MADFQDLFKEAWSHALAGASAAEQEAEKVLARLADVAGLSPEEVRRHARELGERLASQRRDLERGMDEAVQRAANRFRIPSRDEIETLQKRVETLAQRIETLAKERAS